MNRSTTNLQAETPALVTPLYQTENCKRILSIIKLLSDCVNTTDKNKPYWNNIWIYGAFYMEKKYSFCQSNPPPILNQPLLPEDELFFHVCNAFKHK